MDELLSRVVKTIRQERLLQGGERVLVALSGGPDSVALLRALLELRELLQLEVEAAHVNHQLRGEESEADERFVSGLCRRLQVPLRLCRVPPPAPPGNLEDRLRRLRYDALARLALEAKARVATAHTLSDQVETFLMKLFRGAGPAGLSGISPRRLHVPRGSVLGVDVIRPLLAVSRREVLAFLERIGQPAREDSWNRNLSFHRNWVRLELIPLLEERLNPAVARNLARTAQLFRELEEFLEEEGETALQRCSEGLGPGEVKIERLVALPPVLQKQVVRRALWKAKGDLKNVKFSHIEQILRLARGRSGRQVHLPGGLVAAREFDRLRLFAAPARPAPFQYRLPVPGVVRVPQLNKTVESRLVPAAQAQDSALRLSPGCGPLWVRNRRPGDRYQVSPATPRRKLKKLLMESRIPAGRRDQLLVIASAGKVHWVEGFPPDAGSLPRPEDREVLEIRLRNETLQSQPQSKVVAPV